jgi:tetratricopeptide (TPR) repeat protein
MDCLGIHDDDADQYDSQSDITDDDGSSVADEASMSGLPEDLRGAWNMGDMGHLEWACFAALCSLFFDPKATTDLPPPHRALVIGLWANVVLPPLLHEEDYHKIPELVAQDVWDVLFTELQWITEDDHNVVTVSNAMSNVYGQRTARPAGATKWKHDFAAFLESSLNGDQPHVVQLYASQVIIPYWLYLGEVARAASLLHRPCYISKEWSMHICQENPLQITQRHLNFIELYLSKLAPCPTKWQEALGLYQGWHTLLQQQLQICLDQAIDATSDHSQDGSTSPASFQWSKDRGRRPRDKRRGDPKQLLLLGNSLLLLSSSLDSVLTDFPGQDAAVKVLWRRQAEYLADAMRVLRQVEDERTGDVPMRRISNLLSAKAWLSLSSSCAIVEESGIDDLVDVDMLSQLYDVVDMKDCETNELKCLHVANVLLALVEPSKKSSALQLMVLSLKADLQDTWGRWLYHKNRFDEARLPLEDATKVRRQILALRKDTPADSSTLFWWRSVTSKEDDDEIEAICRGLCLDVTDTARQVQETEVALAQSLEYAALALHACGRSMTATSWLQEALILKTGHCGRMSLEVARLNATMATVLEDHLQWEPALSRYRECLRIRMHVWSQKEPEESFTSERDLFQSVLENLASMGSVYRMLGDHDNAVGCHWKIATFALKEWESLSSTTANTSFWGFEGQRKMASDFRTIPLPTFELEEVQYSKTNVDACPPQVPPLLPKNDIHEAESLILSRSAQAYQTILTIFEEKAKIVSPTCTPADVADEDLPMLLVATYRLGMINIHFGQFRSAIRSLEHCLSALWILDPSSSDSSSDDDDEQGYFPKGKRHKPNIKGSFGKELQEIDDEAVYHALGICRAACGEHDRALRFHLTALRCARRLHGVDSVRASEVLYDAAISYWYLKEYAKAEEFWSSCLRMRSLMDERGLKESEGELCIDDARILYNIGAALCALGRYSEPRTEECLENARQMFTTLFDSQIRVEVASCFFYLSLVQLRKGSSDDVRLLKDCSRSFNRASSIYGTIGYLRSSSDACAQDEPLNTNTALRAHFLYVEASISEALGKLHRALDIYGSALLRYRSLAETGWEMYVASVLNKIAKLVLRTSRDDDAALVYFEEAFRLRKECLGDMHEAVGDTIYHMAEIHSRIGNHAVAMEMYHEALRIQILADGRDGAAVAMTLQMIASLCVREGDFDMAMEKLRASLLIRENRVKLIDRASWAVKLLSDDLADDFLALSEEASNQESGGHIRKTLQDDLVKEEVGLAVVHHCMGNIWVRLGDLSQARECFEQSLRVRRSHPTLDVMSHDETILLHVWDTLHNLACVHELQNDYAKAVQFYTAALKLKYVVVANAEGPDVSNRLVGSDYAYQGISAVDGRYLNSYGSVSYAMTLHRLGTVYFRIGDRNTAISCLGSALRIQRHFLGTHHFTVTKTLVDLACTLRKTEGKKDEARICYKEAYEIRTLRNRRDADVGHILYHMGQLHDASKDYKQASAFYIQAIQTYGRRHVNAIFRRACQHLFSRKVKVVDDASPSDDLLAKDGLRVASIEETDDMIGSYLVTASRALRESTRMRVRSMDSFVMMDLDMHAPDCLISLELYLFRLFELIHFLSGEIARRTSQFTSHALCQFERLGVEGVKTSQDAITFQMLFLIPE